MNVDIGKKNINVKHIAFHKPTEILGTELFKHMQGFATT